MHGNEFRPGGRVRSKFKSEFLNTPNASPPVVGANHTHGPRGFFTSPLKHGAGPGTTLQKQNYEHMVDEYDRKRDLVREERMKRRAQQLSKPFSNVVRGKRTFGKDFDEYGEDKLNLPAQKAQKQYQGLKHIQPFRHTMHSPWIGKTINKHPEYQEERLDVDPADRMRKTKDLLPWRPTHKRMSVPDESINDKYRNRTKYPFM